MLQYIGRRKKRTAGYIKAECFTYSTNDTYDSFEISHSEERLNRNYLYSLTPAEAHDLMVALQGFFAVNKYRPSGPIAVKLSVIQTSVEMSDEEAEKYLK